jgi:hypothetical protein
MAHQLEQGTSKGVNVMFKLRQPYSIKHIQSAVIFCKKCSEIERQNTINTIDPEVRILHQAYVLNSIISSVAFLEAFINELFCDSQENIEYIKKSLDNASVTRLSRMWELEVPKTASYKIVQKYQIALTLTDKIAFGENDEIFQDIKTLTKLRNELIHYEPKWIEIFDDPINERNNMINIGKRLQHKKISHNPFVEAGRPYFPDKCLGYGCAQWAVMSSLTFCEKFCEKMNLSEKSNLIQKEIAPYKITP